MEGYAQFDDSNLINESVQMEMEFFERAANSSQENEDSDEIIVRIRNLHKTYLLGLEGVPALRGVSLEITRGEFVCILGKSGGGKTSLLNCIGTIDKPTKGDLYICGKRVSSKTPDAEVAKLRLNNIGFCFQTFNLIGSMNAVENVELPMILDGRLTSQQMRTRAMNLLDQVGMSNRATSLPSQLSGGEQQRVTISRAVANQPDLLLLDEPTGDLDTRNSNIVVDLLVNLNRKERMTMVLVTHDVSLKNFAHRVVHMLDGKISRIEEIPQETRDEAELNLREALNSPEAKAEGFQRETEIREPSSHYSFHRFTKQYQEHKQKLLDMEESVEV